MSMALIEFTERLVPISDFSQGKAGKIFSDVSENDHEYIILKNNQPTAVLLSIKEYKAIQEKLSKMDRLLEYAENMRLLNMAKEREDSNTTSFEHLLEEEGFAIEEIAELANQVEFD